MEIPCPLFRRWASSANAGGSAAAMAGVPATTPAWAEASVEEATASRALRKNSALVQTTFHSPSSGRRARSSHLAAATAGGLCSHLYRQRAEPVFTLAPTEKSQVDEVRAQRSHQVSFLLRKCMRSERTYPASKHCTRFTCLFFMRTTLYDSYEGVRSLLRYIIHYACDGKHDCIRQT